MVFNCIRSLIRGHLKTLFKLRRMQGGAGGRRQGGGLGKEGVRNPWLIVGV